MRSVYRIMEIAETAGHRRSFAIRVAGEEHQCSCVSLVWSLPTHHAVVCIRPIDI